MHSIVTTFRGAVIKVEVANFCAAMDTLIDQDGVRVIQTVIPQNYDLQNHLTNLYMYYTVFFLPVAKQHPPVCVRTRVAKFSEVGTIWVRLIINPYQ